MRPQLIATFLLALWVLATNHAAFEIAGLMHHTLPSEADNGQERWHHAEKTMTKENTDLLIKPAALQPVLSILEIVARSEWITVKVVELDAPPVERAESEFRSWHFVRRDAPLPGAPALGA